MWDDGEESEAGLGSRRGERMTRPVRELDTHLGLVEPVLARERRDDAREPMDELVQRTCGTRRPDVRRHR